MTELKGTLQGSPHAFFSIRLDDDLPPLPGATRIASPSCTTLHHLLNCLIEAARCNVIAAPAREPDPASIQTSFAALSAASESFLVATGVSLSQVFWTHGSALRQGEIAKGLRDLADNGRPQGFLALYAREVRSPLLYSENSISLRVRDAIEVPPGASGPFLVLVVCELTSSAEAIAVKGYAQPIYHGARFVPVGSEFERDVLRLLEHFQIALDAHGVEVDIIRHLAEADPIFGPWRPPQKFSLAVRDGIQAERRINFVVGANKGLDRTGETNLFIADLDALTTGAFVSWLKQELSAGMAVGSYPEERRLPALMLGSNSVG